MKRAGVLPILNEAIASNDIAIRHLAHDCMKNILSATDWDSETSDESDSYSDDTESSDEDFDEGPESNSDLAFSETESSESDDTFFGDIKNDVESLKKEKENLDLELEIYRNKIKTERNEGKKLKENLLVLKKQLEKRCGCCDCSYSPHEGKNMTKGR